MSPTSHIPVAILGAGLAGMGAAERLLGAGVACRLIEKASRPGGLAVTDEEQGYRFDRTGHLLHFGNDRELAQLTLGWIGPEHCWVARRSVVWSHGRYTRYPYQSNAHGLPPEVAYACVMGFIEAERARAAGDLGPAGDFGEYCLQHFGRGISEHFMFPYNSRMWGVTPGEMTARWCERFVPRPRLEEVIAGAVGRSDPELGYNARFVFPTRGIGRLSDAIAAALGPVVTLGCAPVGIDAARRELALPGEQLRYEVLISSVPLPELVRLCHDAPEPVRRAAAELRCTHLYYLDLALRQPCALPYHWIYVPEQRYPFYRVGSYSNLSVAMAPPGCGSLYVELVDRAEPDLATLLPVVYQDLVGMGLIDGPRAVAFARLRRIDHAYVVFDHRHKPALAVVQGFLASAGILSTGRYGGWTYCSMAEALRLGREAAREAIELLEHGR